MNYSFSKKTFVLPIVPEKFNDLDEARKVLVNFNKVLSDMIISLRENDMHTYEDYYSKFE